MQKTYLWTGKLTVYAKIRVEFRTGTSTNLTSYDEVAIVLVNELCALIRNSFGNAILHHASFKIA